MTLIRSNHPYAFRSGRWARIVTQSVIPDVHPDRGLFQIQFEDGYTDWWPVNDPVAEYEYRDEDTPRQGAA
jgi:hypothetical protein